MDPFVVRIVVMLGLVVIGQSGVFAQGQSRRVEASRDLWVSAYRSEQGGNNGGAAKLKLKGFQEFFLIDFDPQPFAGQYCVAASLHLMAAGDERLGRVTISTITAPWFEGSGSGYQVTSDGSSFLFQKGTQDRWPGDSGDLTGVILGSGGSRWGFADASPPDAAMWQAIPIDPAVVQARIDGESEGFFVIDDVGSEYSRDGNRFDYKLLPNRFFHSRESSRSRAPYFSLTLRPRGPGDPPPPAALPPASGKDGEKPLTMPIDFATISRALRDAPTPKDLPPSATQGPLAIKNIDGVAIPNNALFAARAETIGFLIDADPATLRIEADDSILTSVYRTPLVGGQVDPLVPHPPEPDSSPGRSPIRGGDDAKTAASTATSTAASLGPAYIELHVTKGAKPGPRSLTIRTAQETAVVTLQVWNFALPDRLSFIPQMNAYGVPDDELDYFRLAHDHRVTLNHLRYGWTGRVDQDAVPVIAPVAKDERSTTGGSGWDWTKWDAKFGPLLDGSAFRDSRRGPVPIEAFYLPLNENWPMDHESHFKGGYWVEGAYDEAYWQEFRDAVDRFVDHFEARGWDKTVFEFYLNNKVYFKANRDNRWDACSAPWVFDEPANTQDFWALRRFGREFWNGVQGRTSPRLAFRTDISRPQWQRELLDDVSNVQIVSGVLRDYPARVLDRAAKHRNLVSMYGSAGDITPIKSMPAAWCVEAWSLGADGVVPWQTIGTKKSWSQPDPLSLFYPTDDGPIPSIRLKSFMIGQQLTEYLTIFAKLSGVPRSDVGEAVLALPGFQAETVKQGDEDAGTARFSGRSLDAIQRLRVAIGQWIDAKAPADRDLWHDPAPPNKPVSPIETRTVIMHAPSTGG